MNNDKKVRIGCASAFWGDTSTAARQLVEKGKLDYLVFDFLAEVTMSILARAKSKDNKMGYATDFVRQLKPILHLIKRDKIKVLSNAGGINPNACRDILKYVAKESGIELNIATVIGDDLISDLPRIKDLGITEMDRHNQIPESCLSINAYLGAPGMVQALKEGADIVITGRVVDSALVLAPLIYEFDWTYTDYDLLASGSLAGHIIECGAQCTGGNYTDWKEVEGFHDMGFPIVEVERNGDFVVSKPDNTGGMITFGTVAEQFLYEIGNPAEYILPDVVCDFTNVTIDSIGEDLVQVRGASGSAPTDHYKVSATYKDGYRVTGTLVIGGKEAGEKGKRIANAIIRKVSDLLIEQELGPFKATSFDLIGTDSIYGSEHSNIHSREIVLRLVATHMKKQALIIFSREMAQAATGMAAGVINYLGGRPSVSPSIHLFSFLFPKDQITVNTNYDNHITPVTIITSGGYLHKRNSARSTVRIEKDLQLIMVPLSQLAYARSGDKGNHANIGVISRKPEYLQYIQRALSSEAVANYFSHVLDGKVLSWDVPGINGLNFLLMNSLGGGGMASMNIDPQGKSYAQQLLEYEIPIDKDLITEKDKV
ncbi:MAG: acyclic terpene utilization AtuA family protein [Candidatus Neomarinimicrobiota bacterium]